MTDSPQPERIKTSMYQTTPKPPSEAESLVKTWLDRIEGAKKHWEKFHKRAVYSRELVRGIDDAADEKTPNYNEHRANLIQSTIAVVLSRVYAKNPEMSGRPTNKAQDLALLSNTLSQVTQAMLTDAKLKKKAKSAVRAALTTALGIVKVQYQRDLRTDPHISDRIQDTQDNIARIEGMIRAQEDGGHSLQDLESQKQELQQALSSLQATPEVVAAEGLVVDRVATERLLVDPAVEDFWDSANADYMVEQVPMRKSKATGIFKDLDANCLDKATTYKAGKYNQPTANEAVTTDHKTASAGAASDPMLMVYEVWHKADNTVYTLIEGIKDRWAREPYSPEKMGERWYPYFLLPFQTVDGKFTAQSMVDSLEKLQEEHNETRDKFAELRRTIKPHYITTGDTKAKDIKKMVHPDLGEILVVDTGGQSLDGMVKVREPLRIDPGLFDTGPIRSDWEMVSGLQEAARSTVMTPKTATEASISEQSLAAKVSEFRDQVEDWLTEIAQYSSELCLLNMEEAQVATIMGQHDAETGAPAYLWPQSRTPDTVFNLIELQIRAGSTAAPNKLAAQESWSKALPLLREMLMVIRQLDAQGQDSTAERELVKETAARFDETIDVDRFLPPKPKLPPMPALPTMPGQMPGMGAQPLPPLQ